MEGVTITRHGNDTAGEYQAHVPGSDLIGRLTWLAHGNARVATHTGVPAELEGRGIAGKLVQALIEDARAEGFKVVPQCSYVAVAFKRHPEWADLLA